MGGQRQQHPSPRAPPVAAPSPPAGSTQTLSAGLEAISVLCVSFDTPCKSHSLGHDGLCRDSPPSPSPHRW